MFDDPTAVDFLTLTPLEVKSLPHSRKLQILRNFRNQPSHSAPSLILLCSSDIIASSKAQGEELYAIYEQCLLAALDCGKKSTADECYKQLQSKFGSSSTRVQKLKGLIYESCGDWKKAKELYAKILLELPMDGFVVKRMVAMCKSTGDYKSAIDVLEKTETYKDEDGQGVKFLQVHSTHEPVYRELSSLHFEVGNLESAIYYAELATLFNPLDHQLLNRLAELCYSYKNYEKSVTLYSHSLRLLDTSHNCRAAYGLLAATNEMLKQASTSKPQQSSNSTLSPVASSNNSSSVDAKALHLFAVGKLKQMYGGSSMISVVNLMLQKTT